MKQSTYQLLLIILDDMEVIKKSDLKECAPDREKV